MDLNIIFLIASVLAAFISGYYAFKSYCNYRFNIMPLLIPENDVADPKKLKIKIRNRGKGPARAIEVIIDALKVKEKNKCDFIRRTRNGIFKRISF